MSVLAEVRARFRAALTHFPGDPEKMLELIRPSQDTRFGDYQVNCAMPLQKLVGKPPREIAAELLAGAKLEGFATAEIAGPGFINLRLDDAWVSRFLQGALCEDRLGVAPAANPRRVVVDFSSPNVAKPMHVGHIRSTVIGDALTRILRFAGHQVVSDNHLGDWGTQFGMIIYGYRHFVDAAAYAADPIAELGRLYKLVRRLSDYQEAVGQLPAIDEQLSKLREARARIEAANPGGDKSAAKQRTKDLAALAEKIAQTEERREEAAGRIAQVKGDPQWKAWAENHSAIEKKVLEETAKLHAGDPENLRLWHEFLPHCRADIHRIYQRLNVTFDEELGESFYQDRLAGVVESLVERGLARLSDGATCVFLDGFETPFIIRKKDGAFLYATSDLATIAYRVERWNPDAILYVVDHRQHEHFEKLFAAARQWGYDQIELTHVSFGTVLGDDGKPFKTRSGDTVGLEGLLEEAIARARTVLEEKSERDFSESEKQRIAEVVGIGAIKYADLSQNRTSDYKFSYDKMLALVGNTGPYLQYLYPRVRSVLAKADADPASWRKNPQPFEFAVDAERKLAVSLLRFGEAIDDVLVDYRPNLLTNYLYDLTQSFFEFYQHKDCKILEAPNHHLRTSRLQLCDLAGRTIELGLQLLGIGVVQQM